MDTTRIYIDKPRLCSLDIYMDIIGLHYRIHILYIYGYLWITLWDHNQVGYHIRILKDTNMDIYGSIKVMIFGYN
jgi:hypothetical protein